MKRIFSAVFGLFVIYAVFLTSCSKPINPGEQLKLPLKITANINGSQGVFNIEILEDGFKVSFGEEHILKDTFLEFNGNEGVATVGDFKREVRAEMFPAQNALAKALQSINRTKTQPTESEKGFKYAIDEMRIMVYYDMGAEKIIGIETEESGKRFYFNISALEPYEEQSNSEG